ncbi:MAG: metallophosphoesterase [Clostridiaceae bacterium]|nr:metallophosphoesterase [Clostridiaceae bacterium]
MAKSKRKFKYLLYISALIIFFFYWQNNTIQVTRYRLNYDNLPQEFNGYRIVQISDMHGKTFGYENGSLARKIKALKPDIVIATGDMMSSNIDDGKAFLDFLDHFNNASPVYMCLGNHEQIARILNGMDEIYKNFITEAKNRGVILLDNEEEIISKGQDSIIIKGLTLELYHYSRRDLDPEDESLYLKTSYVSEKIGTPQGFTILMAHNPAYFEEYVEWGADLTLSGHVHGGIIQVPFKGGLLSPERVFFPKYDAGLFENDNKKMIVNRGLGNSQINFRLFNRPEVTLIELKNENLR